MPAQSTLWRYNPHTDQVEQFEKPKSRVHRAKWPIYSDRAGVNPHQIPEAEATMKNLGVETKFDERTGCAIFRDAKHRKAHCEAIGIYDRNGGYSDPMPQ